jgi:hypothetical protein
MNIEETLKQDPLPKATKSYLKNPLPPETFERHFNFSENEIAGTELDAYLKNVSLGKSTAAVAR